MGVARCSRAQDVGWGGHEGGVHVGGDDVGAPAGAQDARRGAALDQDADGVSVAGGSQLGEMAQEEGQRDVEGIDTRPHRQFQPQCLDDLGNAEHRVDLLHDQRRGGRPDEVQAQLAFDELERQLDGPAILPPKQRY